eukprot:m.68000 g.68000  ORF g.68000 m.68000 type:complete len:738 (-) comp23901_c0_seq1:284-2497(-)
MSVRNPRVRIVVPPPPNQRDISSTWDQLREAFIHIQEQKSSIDFSYQELYRLTYNLVMGQQTVLLYSGLEDVVRAHLKSSMVLLLGKNEGCLQNVTKLYGEHYESMLRIRDVMLYLDSRRGRRQKPVFDIGISYFLEEIVLHSDLRPRIEREMLDIVQRFRESETIDRQLLKKVTDMLVELGVCEESHAVYVQVFEAPFLITTGQYYGDMSQKLLKLGDAATYLRQVQQIIDNEISLVGHCLDKTTFAKLNALLHEKLIGDHMDEIIDSHTIRQMLDEERIEDLRLVYRLYKQVPGGLPVVVELVRNHILQAGKANLGAEDVASDSKGPIKIVSNFAELMTKHFRILDGAFENDPKILRGINSTYHVLLNKHDRIEEYLSMYIDHVLKSSLKDIADNNIEVVLDRAIRMFRLLQEKDVFERYYKLHLAKRLLSKKAASMAHEQMVIQRLKTECGFQYTARFETMFKDMRVSDELMEVFNASKTSAWSRVGKLEFDVRVLATGMWPTEVTSIQTLPTKLLQATKIYEEFYQSKHEGRKLTWVNTLGTMTLSAKFGKLTDYHILAASTCQGLVLLMFNEGHQPPSLSFDEMKQRCGLPVGDLKRALQALSQGKFKILVKTSEGKSIGAEDTFTLNEVFSSKNVRIKIPQIVAKETTQEKEGTKVKVDEDRRFLIEACIVRVMKARKQIHHNDLVVEVTKLLTQHFSPSPKNIKSRIARLIEAEYIERTADDQKIYKYLA